MRILENFCNRVGLSLIVTVFTFFLLDIFTGHTLKSTGRVLEKVYVPERNYTTQESRMSNGQTNYYSVHHHDPAEWSFIVEGNNGEIVKVRSSARNYYSTDQGEVIAFSSRYGRYTKYRYLSAAVEY